MIFKLLSLFALLSVVQTNSNRTISRNEGEDFSVCEVRSSVTSLVIQGTDFKRGKWPWTVALMHAASPSKFFCGAVLVGPRKVVTAAHCIQDKYDDFRKKPDDVLALFGAHDLTQLTLPGVSSAKPKEILLHPEWNPASRIYDSDIAVLLMEEDIAFNNYVRPICLPQAQSSTLGRGFVTGWGESENNEVEKIPREIEVPIYENERCIREAADFKNICSENTLCAGSQDGSRVCRGDSGGGLFVISANIYVLKGIVSVSLTSEGGKCDITNFALYTNVEKFIEWIKNPTEYLFITHIKTTTKRSTTTKKPLVCGGLQTQTSLIRNGQISERSDFPWTVAIFCKNRNQPTVFCSTGTLVSVKHVVTTASAIYDAHNNPRDRHDFLLYFGISDMEDQPIPVDARFVDGVAKVTINRKFSSQSRIPKTNNIAILTLKKKVPMNQNISPVCLPDEDVIFENYQGRNAFAAGWGQDEDGLLLRVKKYAQMKFRSKDECNKHFWFDQRASKFFCAGGNGIRTACNGDDSLYFKINDRWYFSGLLAQTLMVNRLCDMNRPFLYEDIAQHSNWIKSVIDQ